MNRREQAVLLLLTAAFLGGLGVSYCKRGALRRRAALSPVSVVTDTATGWTPYTVPLLVDLNQATPGQLDGLPGIGRVLASRIIEYRQRSGGFRRIAELREVPGIGEKRYSALKDLVTVGPSIAAESGR